MDWPNLMCDLIDESDFDRRTQFRENNSPDIKTPGSLLPSFLLNRPIMLCRRILFLRHNISGPTLSLLTKIPHLPPSSITLSFHLTTQKRHSGTTTPTPRLPLPARIVSSLPASIKPYAYLARLHAPVGSWLLYWPCGLSPFRRSFGF